MQKISYLFLIKVKSIKTGVSISTWFVHTGIDSKSIFTIREMFFSYKFVLSLSLVQDHWLFILVETPRCNQADKGWSICFTYNKLFMSVMKMIFDICGALVFLCSKFLLKIFFILFMNLQYLNKKVVFFYLLNLTTYWFLHDIFNLLKTS